MTIRRLRRIVPLAVTLAAAACGNPREDARNELQRLATAMDAHAGRYGRYPEAIDPRRPASAANLPHAAEKGVRLRLVHSGVDAFQALARQGPWICSLNVAARRAGRVECTPLSSSAEGEPPTPSSGSSPLDSAPHQGTTAAP